MKFILYFIFICIAYTSYSQTPGYLGKRISIEGDINTLPSFNDLLLGNQRREVIKDYSRNEIKNKNYSILKMNFNSSLIFNYSISRKADICLRLNYSRDNMLLKNQHGQAFYLSTVKNLVPFQTIEYDLNFKFYRKNFIAPVGKYVNCGIGYSKASSLKQGYDVEYLTRLSYNSPEFYGTRTVSNSSSFFMVNVGIGDKKVNKNNTYFLYGLEYKYYYFLKPNTIFNSLDTAEKIIASSFSYNVRKNLIYSNLFNLKIGFGIIL